MVYLLSAIGLSHIGLRQDSPVHSARPRSAAREAQRYDWQVLKHF
jgi:hypothetical protein